MTIFEHADASFDISNPISLHEIEHILFLFPFPFAFARLVVVVISFKDPRCYCHVLDPCNVPPLAPPSLRSSVSSPPTAHARRHSRPLT